MHGSRTAEEKGTGTTDETTEAVGVVIRLSTTGKKTNLRSNFFLADDNNNKAEG